MHSSCLANDHEHITTVSRWFYGQLTAQGAEHLLMKPCNGIGSFLVRNSTTYRNSPYTLSLCTTMGVMNYRIKKNDNGAYSIQQSPFHRTVQDLVAYVDNYGLRSESARDEVLTLTQPCKVLNKEWELERNHLRLVHKRNKGSFAGVWEGEWMQMGTVAIKIPDPEKMTADEFQQQARLMKKLHHPHVIRLLGVCTVGGPKYIVTELMKHGNLHEFLRREGRQLDQSQLISMAAQIASGMAYLGQMNIIHQQLTADNILVGECLVCKIGGFRVARERGGKRESGVYPIKWMAPESWKMELMLQSDIWSFGVVLYEIVTYGDEPYRGTTNDQVRREIESGYRMPKPDGCPGELYDIMLQCWSSELTERPSFQCLYQRLTQLHGMASSTRPL